MRHTVFRAANLHLRNQRLCIGGIRRRSKPDLSADNQDEEQNPAHAFCDSHANSHGVPPGVAMKAGDVDIEPSRLGSRTVPINRVLEVAGPR
jgi:hypothetical protein